MKAFKNFFKEIDASIVYDPDQLAQGIQTELEHTPYKSIATIIAKHHLAEDPQYYTKLSQVEQSGEDEEDHKPRNPGILKRRIKGKITCSKARSLKSGTKNKGSDTAKAAQRFLNYHCQSENEEQRLDPKCWEGYRKEGTKMKGGKRVNNCVKIKS